MFPRIEHIDQVKAAIVGCGEFVVAERDDYTVINYLVSNDSTFPPVVDDHSAIRRECRGLIFDKNGKLISRPFHKFFNVNEREETQASLIDFTLPHVILDKLDGSMVRPIKIHGIWRLATKMGITDVALQAEEFIRDKEVYQQFFDFCEASGMTPIFEWLSRKNRIVIDYPFDELVLLAIRDTLSGMYHNYQTLECMSLQFSGIGIVRQYPGTMKSMQNLIEYTKGLQGVEGFVVRFDTGYMVKVKGEWYVQIHKAKDQINLEKNLIKMLIDNGIDDVLPFLMDNDKDRLVQYEYDFWNGVHRTVAELNTLFSVIRVDERKEFALNVSMRDKKFAPILFKMFDGHDAFQLIIDTIRKNINTKTKVDSIRWIFKTNWNEVNAE